jgi:hypothetical protein
MTKYTYYVTKNRGFFYLRQTRFKHLNYSHPHDICAAGWSNEKGIRQIESLSGKVDPTSAVADRFGGR